MPARKAKCSCAEGPERALRATRRQRSAPVSIGPDVTANLTDDGATTSGGSGDGGGDGVRERRAPDAVEPGSIRR